MGLGDFLGGFLGTSNNYHADPRVNSYVAPGDYSQQIADAYSQQKSNQLAQGSYIQQLQDAANGQGGPSVAEQLLRRQTDQNNAATASAAASTRGMNPALAARLALVQGAQNGQSSAGQAALLRAQEITTARGQLGGALGTQGEQNLQGLNIAANQQAGVNNLNAGVANQNANLALAADQINAGVAAQNASSAGKLIGGLIGGTGAFGPVGLGGQGDAAGASTISSGGGGGAAAGSSMLEGGSLAGSSEGAAEFALMYRGGQVPGRAPVQGNSPTNDRVDAKLSPGEIVLPRSVTEGADAPDRAAAFVRAIQRKYAAEKGPKGYGAILAMQRDHAQRLARLEARPRAA